MLKTLKTLASSCLLLLVVLAIAPSCKKDLNNYDLTVRVTVYDSVQVSNALVRVYAPVEGSFIDYYQYTDEQGESVFKIEGKAVLEVEAGKGSFKSCGFVELFEGGTLYHIDLKPFGDNENGCK